MNQTKRTPEQVKQLIFKQYFKLPKPLPSYLLLGPPGIGKSESIRQLAQEIAQKLNLQFIEYDDLIADKILQNPNKYFVFVDFRLTECEPSDLLGIPRSDTQYVEFKPLKWAYVLSKTAGILFLDELTNIQRDDVKAVAYKLLLDRKAGFVKLNNDVIIISAGNSPEYSSIANALPSPLINRLVVINVEKPTLDEWLNYMNVHYGDSWCKRIYAYLMLNSQEFIKVPDSTETLVNYPTPRSWTKLAVTLTNNYLQIYDSEEVKTLSIGFLGEEVGLKVAKFLLLNIPTISELLENPATFEKLDLDVKYAFTVQYALWINENEKQVFTIQSGKYIINEKHRKLIEEIINDSEELALVFIHSFNVKKLAFALKFFLTIPRFKELVQKLKQLKEKVEKGE